MQTKITRSERRGLTMPFNLSDAHTHQGLSADQDHLIRKRLPEIFEFAACTRQDELEAEAYRRFMELSGQRSVKLLEPLVCYSASMAMEVLANRARMSGDHVALVEPCFDNIPDILKRHGVRLSSYPAAAYDDAEQLIEAISEAGATVLMMVLPNNPTGHWVTANGLWKIAQACHSKGIVIWLDFCFRLYEPGMCQYDQYQILLDSGVDFVGIEDTGKIWPTLDQKASFIVASGSQSEALELIHDDFLLNVSPLTLAIISEFSAYSATVALQDFRKVIDDNRISWRSWVEESLPTWHSLSIRSSISVEFGLLCPPNDPLVKKFESASLRSRVAFLSGQPFYWSEPNLGVSCIRVALARDQDYFRRGLESIGRELAL